MCACLLPWNRPWKLRKEPVFLTSWTRYVPLRVLPNPQPQIQACSHSAGQSSLTSSTNPAFKHHRHVLWCGIWSVLSAHLVAASAHRKGASIRHLPHGMRGSYRRARVWHFHYAQPWCTSSLISPNLLCCTNWISNWYQIPSAYGRMKRCVYKLVLYK
jgi:hypothetical protein